MKSELSLSEIIGAQVGANELISICERKVTV